MKKYIISTSNTADFTPEYIASHDIKMLNLTYILDDEEYPKADGAQHTIEEIYKLLREGKVIKTSMVNGGTYEEFFTKYLEEGYDILHIELSSGLSGSYANGASVAKELKEKYPESKLYVVDSLCASTGMGLLVDYALDMRDAGKSIDEVYNWVEENKLNVLHWFTVDDLEFLRRGGRISGISAFLGGMLKIKPVLNVNKAGKLIAISKVRGRKKAIAAMVKEMQKDIKNPDGQKVFICHGDCIEDAKYLESLVLEAFPGVKETMIAFTGSVIGSHSGPGTLALFYVGNERFEKQ